MITNLTGITEQMLADDGLEKPVVAERFAEMLRAGADADRGVQCAVRPLLPLLFPAGRTAWRMRCAA